MKKGKYPVEVLRQLSSQVCLFCQLNWLSQKVDSYFVKGLLVDLGF